jgi:hypothetical protein
LGPAWKFLKNDSNREKTKMVDTKQYDILKEYSDLDEKYYIPLQDLFHLIRSPDKDSNVRNYIESSEMFPNEYGEYVSDMRRIDPYTTI